MTSRSWIPYAALLILFWSAWGAFSSLPADEYGYPDEMIYILWSITMLIHALAPVLTVLISLAVYQTLPSVYGAVGIVPAIVGSTLMVYGDEKRGEVDAEEQAAIANETSDASPGRSEADKPTV